MNLKDNGSNKKDKKEDLHEKPYKKSTTEEYYKKYSVTDIFINNTNSIVLGLDQHNVFLKISVHHLKVILYSFSMTCAEVIVPMDIDKISRTVGKIKGKGVLSLSFLREGKTLSYFINISIKNVTENPLNLGSCFIKFDYYGTIPDDIIRILGEFLDTKSTYFHRKEERIKIKEESTLKGLRYASQIGILECEKFRANFILRNISFLGAQIVVKENPDKLLDKPIKLHISTIDYGDLILQGKIIRTALLSEIENLTSLAIELPEDLIPETHKFLIANFLQKNIFNT